MVSWSECSDLCVSLNATFLNMERHRLMVRLYFILYFWDRNREQPLVEGKVRLLSRGTWVKPGLGTLSCFTFQSSFPGVLHLCTPCFLNTPCMHSLHSLCVCCSLDATMANYFTSFNYSFCYHLHHETCPDNPTQNCNLCISAPSDTSSVLFLFVCCCFAF